MIIVQYFHTFLYGVLKKWYEPGYIKALNTIDMDLVPAIFLCRIQGSISPGNEKFLFPGTLGGGVSFCLLNTAFAP